MKAFDATKDGAERGAESRAATEGLTSDDVHRKGSLAAGDAPMARGRTLDEEFLGPSRSLKASLSSQRVQESRG